MNSFERLSRIQKRFSKLAPLAYLIGAFCIVGAIGEASPPTKEILTRLSPLCNVTTPYGRAALADGALNKPAIAKKESELKAQLDEVYCNANSNTRVDLLLKFYGKKGTGDPLSKIVTSCMVGCNDQECSSYCDRLRQDLFLIAQGAEEAKKSCEAAGAASATKTSVAPPAPKPKNRITGQI